MSFIFLRFYTVLKLPEGKQNIIAEKNDSPTRYVMNNWLDRDGKQATVKKLLKALKECEQAGLAHRIEQMLGVELEDENDLIDGIKNVHLEQNKSKCCFASELSDHLNKLAKFLTMFFVFDSTSKGTDYSGIIETNWFNVSSVLMCEALSDCNIFIVETNTIRIVKDIPQDLKLQFIGRLKDVDKDVLAKIATAIKEERCYVRDSKDFVEKIANYKTRILFRELQKENLEEIRQWMRNKFPEGSTGEVLFTSIYAILTIRL